MNRNFVHLATCIWLAGLCLTGCHSAQQRAAQRTPQDSLQMLEDHILQVHDSLMGKIDALRQASATMRHLQDSLHLQDTSWTRTIGLLSLADSAMFNWMGQFDIDKDTAQPELRKQYLMQQLQYVERVKDSMYTALDSALLLLKPYTER